MRGGGDGCHRRSISTNTVSLLVLNCYIIDYVLSIMDARLLRGVAVQQQRETSHRRTGQRDTTKCLIRVM